MSQTTLLAASFILGFFVASVIGCCRKCPVNTPSPATEIPLDADQIAVLESDQVQRKLKSLSKLSLSELTKIREPIVSLTPQQEKVIRRDFEEYFTACQLDTNRESDVITKSAVSGKPFQPTQPECNPPLPPLDVRLTKGNTTSISKRDTSTNSICAFYQVYVTPILGFTPDGNLVQLVQLGNMAQVLVEEMCIDNTFRMGNTVVQCCERQRTEDVLVVNIVERTYQVLKIQVSCCTAMRG